MTLLARSFLLIAALIVTAVLASYQIYRVYERGPRSRELAQQTVSALNLTRAALVNADTFLRRELLIDINVSEGLRLYPATASERLDPLPDDPLLRRVASRLRATLGEQTRFAVARDGEEGFWVSFLIDGDEFWAKLPLGRFQPAFGLEWLGWILALLALALAGAWLIASRIARPLAEMTRAAGRIGRGEAHQPLSEAGPRELHTVASAFNRMANDLASMERERAMVLAGISHDLRTPLTRLRLALEMSGAPAGEKPDDHGAMIADIEEIDAILGQFLDFARGTDEQKTEHDLGLVLAELDEHYARLGKPVTFHEHDLPAFPFARMAVWRAIGNLVDNALTYSGGAVDVMTFSADGKVSVEVRDRGPGIPASEIERLKRPFTRLDSSRRGPSGSGLGLAIVERIARAHGGTLEISPRESGGLVARLVLATG